MTPPYLGLHAIEEDKRIDLIGHRVVVHKDRVGFFVDDDAKADRYVAKLKAKFPSISVVERDPGPGDTVFVKVAEIN